MTAFVFSLVLLLGVVLFWAFKRLWTGLLVGLPLEGPRHAGGSGVARAVPAGVGQGAATSAGASRPGVTVFDARTSTRKPGSAAGGATAPAKTAGSAAPAASSQGDNLRRMLGIGPVNERRLKELGVTSFAQIAAWTPEDVKRVEAVLAFDGRIARERWIEQARYLAAGDQAGLLKAFPAAGRDGNT